MILSNLQYPLYTGKMAVWDNLDYALERIQGFMIDTQELKNIVSRFKYIPKNKRRDYAGLIINVETGKLFNGIKELAEQSGFTKGTIYNSMCTKDSLGMVNINTGEFIKTHGKWTISKRLELEEQGYRPAHFKRHKE